MNPSSEPLPRFTRAERWTHRLLAIDLGILFLTAAALYLPAVSSVVGNRPAVRLIHLIAGFALPIPLLIAACFIAFRLDVSRLNRFTPADWAWLRSREARRTRTGVGKFNPGQKLNSAFTLGAIIVMFATGCILVWNSVFADDIRTGATFVHDWLALAFAIVVAGHVFMALRDPVARSGMRTGEVPEAWARHEHPAWAEELDGQVSPPQSPAVPQ